MPLPAVFASPHCEVEFQTTFTLLSALYRRLPSLSAIFLPMQLLNRRLKVAILLPVQLHADRR